MVLLGMILIFLDFCLFFKKMKVEGKEFLFLGFFLIISVFNVKLK